MGSSVGACMGSCVGACMGSRGLTRPHFKTCNVRLVVDYGVSYLVAIGNTGPGIGGGTSIYLGGPTPNTLCTIHT